MRVGERLGVALVDEHAGHAGDARSRAAPPRAERDDRPAARHRFDRDDAEVFLAGQQERRARAR